MSMREFWYIVENIVHNSDYVIEVVDARMIEMTRNTKAESLVRKKGKKLVIVANKADFVSRTYLENYKKKFKIPFFYVSVRDRKGVTILKKNLFKIIGKRSVYDFVNIGVIGYPNTGKSSLINALCGRKAVSVGSKPGRTRGYQWVRMTENIRFIDTPGVIPMTDWNETDQILMNTLDPANAKRIDLAAEEIVNIFLKKNRETFEKMYKIEVKSKSFMEIVESIGESKKMIKKGGEVDERRVMLKLIDDWQKGRILVKK